MKKKFSTVKPLATVVVIFSVIFILDFTSPRFNFTNNDANLINPYYVVEVDGVLNTLNKNYSNMGYWKYNEENSCYVLYPNAYLFELYLNTINNPIDDSIIKYWNNIFSELDMIARNLEVTLVVIDSDQSYNIIYATNKGKKIQSFLDIYDY